MHVRKYRTWEEFLGLVAVLTRVHIYNCLLSHSHEDMSPLQHWTEKEPGVGHLRVFGSTTFVHISKEKKRKLDTKSVKCILVGLGYEENAGSKGYRLDYTANKKIVLCCDVIID